MYLYITYRLKGLGRDCDGEVDLAEAPSAYGVHLGCDPLLLLLAPQHARCSETDTFSMFKYESRRTLIRFQTYCKSILIFYSLFDRTCQKEQQAHRLDAPEIHHCLGVLFLVERCTN